MLKRDIEIGATYIAKVSGRLTKVRIRRESPHGGWQGINIATGREVRIRSAARLRRPTNQDAPFGRLAGGSPKVEPDETE